MVLLQDFQNEQEVFYDCLGDNLTIWEPRFLTMWSFFAFMSKACEPILEGIALWLLKSFNKAKKGCSIERLEVGVLCEEFSRN
jgi:hypothetical protein